MTIQVRTRPTGGFTIVSGKHRLASRLAACGKATVESIDAQDSFEVHLVDGKLVPLQGRRELDALRLAHQAIRRASGK